jgi:CSLREA domain-containing protein
MSKLPVAPFVIAALVLFGTVAHAATYTVSKIADTNDGVCDANCSLREAVAAANATVANDIVVFSALFSTPQTIVLSGSEIVVVSNGSLSINGPGAANLTIDGNLTSRILSSSANAVVNLDGITFTRGNGVGAANTGRGGAIYNVGGTMVISNSIITGNTAPNGGGLNNAASAAPSVPANLTINGCIVSNNTAAGSGGGMQNFSTSTVAINNSLFVGNTSNGTTGGGGGQFNGGVSITNSTFANNSAPVGSGGGIQSNGTLGTTLTNVTVSGNFSGTAGGGIHRGTTNPQFFIRNSIVGGNSGTSGSGDVTSAAGGLQSQGNNIIGSAGASAGWVGTDRLLTDPMLGPLANNGGFSQTFLPQAGSPAINGGQNCVVNSSCSANNAPINVTSDQRGMGRPVGPFVDVGAVEVGLTAAGVVVGGRVLSRFGRGIRGAVVQMTGIDGTPRNTVTGPFGTYKFEDVEAGQTYVMEVVSRRFTFVPVVISVNDNLTDFDLVAEGDTRASDKFR